MSRNKFYDLFSTYKRYPITYIFFKVIHYLTLLITYCCNNFGDFYYNIKQVLINLIELLLFMIRMSYLNKNKLLKVHTGIIIKK